MLEMLEVVDIDALIRLSSMQTGPRPTRPPIPVQLLMKVFIR